MLREWTINSKLNNKADCQKKQKLLSEFTQCIKLKLNDEQLKFKVHALVFAYETNIVETDYHMVLV